jgi:hypothetical protein
MDINSLLQKNIIETAYGGQSQQTDDILNSTQNTGGTYLNNYLQGILKNGAPAAALRPINQQYNQAQTGLKQMLAGSGMSKSGAGIQGFSNLEAGREGAIGSTSLAYQQQAIQALMQKYGIDQNQATAMMQMLVGAHEQQNQIDAQNSGWAGNILGSVLGTAGGIAGGKGLSTLLGV